MHRSRNNMEAGKDGLFEKSSHTFMFSLYLIIEAPGYVGFRISVLTFFFSKWGVGMYFWCLLFYFKSVNFGIYCSHRGEIPFLLGIRLMCTK